MPQCEGWRKSGGAFTLGTAPWVQCSNEAIVTLTVEQDGQQGTFPSCNTCWDEAISRGMHILSVEPIIKEASHE